MNDRIAALFAGDPSHEVPSVGIELELNQTTNPEFTAAQYEAAALITCEMVKRYGIPVDRAHIVGHNEVPGSTHSDPGPTWGWPHFM